MSRHRSTTSTAAEPLVHDLLVPLWEQLADDFPVLSKKTFKARLKRLSRNDQELAWKEIASQDAGRFGEAQAVAAQLKKEVGRVENIAVGSWPDDFKSVAPAAHGEFPPGGKHTLMRRAKGERRYYPPQYLTTSGHSTDVYMQRVYLGRVQALLAEDDTYTDGYRGSVVHVYDLHPADRKLLRRTCNGRAGASNSIDFGGITD